MIPRYTNRQNPLLPRHFKMGQHETPETWRDVTEFARWYLGQGMPLMPPQNVEVFCSDDATAMCVFRKGQFQAEMYLIHPGQGVVMHQHPGVEVIKYYPGTFQHLSEGRFVPLDRPQGRPVLLEGEAHGVAKATPVPAGFSLIALQHWAPGLEPCTVAARWKGKTVGPKQEALIRRFYPEAYVVRGYADVTKKAIPVVEL